MHGVAREFSDALNREVTYFDIPAEDWERGLKKWGCRNTSPGISWRWASCTGRVGMTGWRTAWSG
jgi:hypothetical protein